MAEDKITIKISADLYKKIEDAIKESDLKTVEDFIVKAIEEKIGKEPEDLNKDEEEKVKERLKALGYMD